MGRGTASNEDTPRAVRWASLLLLSLAACTSETAPGGGGARDSGAIDAAFADASPGDADPEDRADPGDRGAVDAPAADAAPGDGGDASGDAGEGDTGTADAGPTDALPSDGPPADAAPTDATPGDAAPGDAAPGDASATDAAPTDAGGPSPGGLCTSTADCVPGEVCGRVRLVNNTIEVRCGPLNAGGAAVGGPCGTDNQCASGFCLSGVVGECTVVCAQPADCPAGFACTGYSYNPGPTTVRACNRACADDDDCAGGNPGNACSLQTWQAPGGGYVVDRVCQAPAGPGILGSACTGGNDCVSGLCLTTTRATSCTAANMCDPFEACECLGGGAPPCPGGQGGSCVSRLCSSLCDDAADCPAGQPLTTCRMDLALGLPDGSSVTIAACGR